MTPMADVATLLSLHEALPTAWRAARAAGDFLRTERPRQLAVDAKSTPTDAVSAMDRISEHLVLGSLLAAYPDDGFLGEESGERLGTSGRRWVVDPLDGTVNYLYGIPLWGVSIGLEDQDGPVLGVVVLPEVGEAYLAVRGGGAWAVTAGVGYRLHGSDCSELSMAMVTTGFGYSAVRRQRQAQIVGGVIGHVRDVRRSGCAVVDFCWLARGRSDAYFEYGLNRWDVAAGFLICQEAGLVLTGLRPESGLDPFFVAAARGIADELRAALCALEADAMP